MPGSDEAQLEKFCPKPRRYHTGTPAAYCTDSNAQRVTTEETLNETVSYERKVKTGIEWRTHAWVIVEVCTRTNREMGIERAAEQQNREWNVATGGGPAQRRVSTGGRGETDYSGDGGGECV